MKNWVLNTFKRIECVQYMCDSNEKCFCGRLHQEHFFEKKDGFSIVKCNEKRETLSIGSFRNLTPNVINSQNDESINNKLPSWSFEKNTKKYPTNSFGNLTFQSDDAYKRTSKVTFITLYL